MPFVIAPDDMFKCFEWRCKPKKRSLRTSVKKEKCSDTSLVNGNVITHDSHMTVT